MVVKSQQYTEKWTRDNDFETWKKENPEADKKDFVKIKHFTATTWKSVIQTPYDASIQLKVIEKEIMHDLCEANILRELGCQEKMKDEYNGKCKEVGILTEENENKNCMYKWDYTANFKTGFWEITIYTIKELIVPVGRRAM